MLLSLSIFLVGFVFLWLGGEWLVRGAAALGSRLQMSPASIGLVFVALGTSAPEFAVSVGAALQDHGDLAAGNVVGSNIVNIALVLGLAAILRAVPLGKSLVRRDLPVMVAATLVVVFMLWDQQITRIEAVVLVGGLIGILMFLVRPDISQTTDELSADQSEAPSLKLSAAWMAGGIVALIAGAECVILGGERLATALGLSEAIIALTLTAIGTGLPEIAATLAAALRHNYGMAMGNVVGSNLFNFGAVLGGSALIAPIQTNLLHPGALIALIAVTVFLWGLAAWRGEVGRWVGSGLVLAYGVYSVALFL